MKLLDELKEMYKDSELPVYTQALETQFERLERLYFELMKDHKTLLSNTQTPIPADIAVEIMEHAHLVEFDPTNPENAKIVDDVCKAMFPEGIKEGHTQVFGDSKIQETKTEQGATHYPGANISREVWQNQDLKPDYLPSTFGEIQHQIEKKIEADKLKDKSDAQPGDADYQPQKL